MPLSQEAIIGLATGLAGTAIAYLSLKREATNTAIEQARTLERRFGVIEADLKLLQDDVEEIKAVVTETQQTTDEIFNLLMIPDKPRPK
jgi:putative NADH-flavin reductase